MNWFKIRYNKKSSKKLGWDPSWLGEDKFDNDLIETANMFFKNMYYYKNYPQSLYNAF